MEKLDFDVLRQQVPVLHYERLQWGAMNEIMRVVATLDRGYGFLLRSIRTKWTDFDEEAPNTVTRLMIEFDRPARGRLMQSEAYNASLISTPGSEGVEANTAPDPVDQSAFGINFTATPVKNNLVLNYFYQYNETVVVKIRTNVTDSRPGPYIDLVIYGILLPTNQVDVWK